MAKKIIMHVLARIKRGCQYKKIGNEISKNNSNSIDGLYVGAKIEYNARSFLHTIE